MSTDLEIYCPDCDSRFGYSGRIPRFCQYCGRSLIDQHPTAENLLTGAVNDSGLQTTEHDDQLTIAPTTPVAGPEPTREVGNAEMVGPYRLVRWLGSGGMGTVWEAIETTSGRRVALKRLSKTMAVDEKYVKRFVREAQLCAKVSHPKVTFIYGSGQQQGQPYIAMELMPGETLADVLKHSGPLEIGYATECVIDVAEGLTAAHEIGLIHRDVKPSNCFVDADRSVKIGDFGLSKSILGKDPNLTRADTFMGTPTYAAPEQIRCEDVDQRTDVYAVGATLYSLLAGRPPFMGDALTVTAQIVTDEPPPISKFRDEVPKPLEKIIAKCLAKDPGKRFESLPDLKLALLPFTNRSDAAVANIGRRLAAFMIDQTIIQTIHFALLVVFLLVWISSMQFPANADSEQIQKLIQERTQPLAPYFAAFLLVLSVIYFSFLEGFFGRGVGKLVMGLKTVNQEGQIPGLQLAFLRTIIIPCCFGIPFLFQLYLLDRFGELNSYTMLIDFVATTTVRSMIAFGLLSTMRISRGMIGVHGILSQTRVIRTLNRKMKIPVLQPRKQKFDPVWFGPYESEQLMGESQFGQVYFGYDGPLKRAVWIVVRPKGKEPPLSRKMLARVSRQRWLEGGFTKDEKRWDAFEAIEGIPIQTFVGMDCKSDWSTYRRLLVEIVNELRVALKDNTVPVQLGLPLIWLDRDGHAKLLDKQLVHLVESEDTNFAIDQACGYESSIPREEAAVKLVQELAELMRRRLVLPISVQNFMDQLSVKPRKVETLDWAQKRLERLSQNLPALTWDTRIGVLGVTLGLEAVVYLTTAAMFFLFCYHVVPIAHEYRFYAGGLLAMILPTVMGFAFKGGPVFQFMGIQITNLSGQIASRLVCGIRAALSWIPAITIMGVSLLWLIFSETRLAHSRNIQPVAGSIGEELLDNSHLLDSSFYLFLAAMLALLVGIFVAILSPKRGFIDFLLGCRLLPK